MNHEHNPKAHQSGGHSDTPSEAHLDPLHPHADPMAHPVPGESCDLEQPAAEGGEGSPLEEQLAQAEARAEASQEAYLRVVAELDNMRKRSARDMEKLRKFANEDFARDLLPVADNMERAMAHIDAQAGEGAEAALKALADGVQMVQTELTRVLGKHGVTRIEALGKPFDHNFHQAVMQKEAEPGTPPHTVIMEMQAGYLLHDRLLRPAMVAVAKE